MSEPKKSSPIAAGVVAVAVVAAAAFGLSKMGGTEEGKTDSPANKTPEANSAPTTMDHANMQHQYKDGTYSATGKYQSPAGPESLGVTLTVQNDIITAASADIKATNPVSVKMQTAFKAGFETQVIGKSLAEVNVTKVSGSSLTPKGFNDAVAQIKVEAKS